MSSKKRIDKKKAREERLRQEKHKNFIRKSYPNIIFINSEVLDRDFRDLIATAIEKVDFLQMNNFHPHLDPREFLRKLAKSTSSEIYFTDEGEKYCNIVHLFVWGAILQNIGLPNIEKYMPEQGFRVFICKYRIFIIGKRFNYSCNQHFRWYTNNRKVFYKDKEYKLFFGKHMFQRLIERLTYISQCNLSNFDKFYQMAEVFCKFYEFTDIGAFKITRNRGTDFIDFYSKAKEHELKFLEENTVELTYWSTEKQQFKISLLGILNSSRKTEHEIFVKRLSCPIETFSPAGNLKEHNSIVVKTSLLPGFDHTIEYNKMMNGKMNMKLNDFLNDIMRNPEKRYGTEYIRAQYEFHKYGIEQFYKYAEKNLRELLFRNVGEDFEMVQELKKTNIDNVC